MPFVYGPRWSGARIGTGYTVTTFGGDTLTPSAGTALAAAVRNLWVFTGNGLPDDVTLSFPAEILQYSNDGVLTGVIPITPPASAVGSFTTNWANGSGTVTRHDTGVVVGGKRLKGYTYFVPRGGAFDATGNVVGTVISADAARWSAFRTDVNTIGNPHVVWSRTNAVTANVIASNTLPRPSGLSSRNDR